MLNSLLSTITGTGDRFGQQTERIYSYIRERENLKKYLIVGPPFGLLIMFFLFPLFSMVNLSFQTEYGPEAVYTLGHYAELFTRDHYISVIWNSLWVTVVTTVLVILFGYLFAYSIVRFSKWTTVLLVLLVLPFWTNYIVRMYAWINILQDGGVINWTELALGITADPTGYLYTWNAVILGFIYIWLPLATLPFYASLAGFDWDLIEASKDLGAGPIDTFTTVTLPLTAGGVLAGAILVAIPTFGAFITPSLLGGTDQVMLGMVIELQFNQAFNWAFAAAASTVLTIAVLLFVAIGFFWGRNVLTIEGV